MVRLKGESRNEAVGLYLGIAVLVLGIALLLTGFVMAFGIAANPRAAFGTSDPGPANETQGPTAQFRYDANDLTVDLVDESSEGDAAIVEYRWDFGDGNTSDEPSPQHTYTTNFSGFVRLTVRDANGQENTAFANVQAAPGIQVSGNSMTDLSDFGSQFDLGQIFAPLADLAVGVASVTATFFMLLIMWLVGASITKAGWNLIRPRPETIRVRIKPKHLEAEPVAPATYAVPPAAPPSTPPAEAPSSEAPPPPPA